MLLNSLEDDHYEIRRGAVHLVCKVLWDREMVLSKNIQERLLSNVAKLLEDKNHSVKIAAIAAAEQLRVNLKDSTPFLKNLGSSYQSTSVRKVALTVVANSSMEDVDEGDDITESRSLVFNALKLEALKDDDDINEGIIKKQTIITIWSICRLESERIFLGNVIKEMLGLKGCYRSIAIESIYEISNNLNGDLFIEKQELLLCLIEILKNEYNGKIDHHHQIDEIDLICDVISKLGRSGCTIKDEIWRELIDCGEIKMKSCLISLVKSPTQNRNNSEERLFYLYDLMKRGSRELRFHYIYIRT